MRVDSCWSLPRIKVRGRNDTEGGNDNAFSVIPVPFLLSFLSLLLSSQFLFSVIPVKLVLMEMGNGDPEKPTGSLDSCLRRNDNEGGFLLEFTPYQSTGQE